MAGELAVSLAIVGKGRDGRRAWRVEQAPTEGELGGATSVGEEAVVTDTMEAARQGVEQEAADELIWGWSRDIRSVWLHFDLLLQFCRSSMSSAS